MRTYVAWPWVLAMFDEAKVKATQYFRIPSRVDQSLIDDLIGWLIDCFVD